MRSSDDGPDCDCADTPAARSTAGAVMSSGWSVQANNPVVRMSAAIGKTRVLRSMENLLVGEIGYGGELAGRPCRLLWVMPTICARIGGRCAPEPRRPAEYAGLFIQPRAIKKG